MKMLSEERHVQNLDAPEGDAYLPIVSDYQHFAPAACPLMPSTLDGTSSSLAPNPRQRSMQRTHPP
jgi:hypothetical protein